MPELVSCTHPHFCPEWDYMFIVPGNDEFDNCLCNCDGTVPMFKDSDFDHPYEKMIWKEWLQSQNRQDVKDEWVAPFEA